MSIYANVPAQPWSAPSPPPPSTALRRTTTSPPTTPSASPVSPTRPGRLRGLSYLRSYTQHHLLSRDSSSSSSSQRPGLGNRATSYPSTSSVPARETAPPASFAPTAHHPTSPGHQRTTSPTTQRSTNELSSQDSIPSTSGWLPTVGGQSGVSRIGLEPQSTDIPSSSAVLSSNGTPPVNPGPNNSIAHTGPATADMPPADIAATSAHQAEDMAVPPHGGDETPRLPSIRFLAHQDPRAQRPSLVFSPMARILPTGREVIKVGRYSERENYATLPTNVPSSAPVGFKSKVVSRRHCEFWCAGGRWFIKDVKSSSGTFLNHIRLSSPNTESRPFPINDGDIVQLGIDFKGGEEMIFRCVKIRVELNKGWQSGPTSFNVASHKRLREMMSNTAKSPGGSSSQDCSICLGPIQPCQSLFVAPCSHTWHYKCIRTIINGPNWPHFLCPNCRTVADLEADLDDPSGEWEEVKASDTDDSAGATSAHNTVPETTAATANRSENTESMLAAVLSADANQTIPESNNHNSVEPDDSGRSVEQASEELTNLSIRDSTSDSDSTHQQISSNSTSSPVNIVRKKIAAGGSRAHATTSSSQGNQDRSRTPSPLSGNNDGPMTPRNDVGPFVFDGTGGQVAVPRTERPPAMNLDAAANDSNPTTTAVLES
ncbi:FHA domain-containing protein [Phlyctema vagabunda]|uniref:FHA domain-containing protein n=1 Tax=Phlyctema vagabunda TaxID=108571 RepID=A0ABR4PIR9_9HELO